MQQPAATSAHCIMCGMPFGNFILLHPSSHPSIHPFVYASTHPSIHSTEYPWPFLLSGRMRSAAIELNAGEWEKYLATNILFWSTHKKIGKPFHSLLSSAGKWGSNFEGLWKCYFNPILLIRNHPTSLKYFTVFGYFNYVCVDSHQLNVSKYHRMYFFYPCII